MNKIIEIEVPRKIFIAGEYAAVAGGSAILFPLADNLVIQIREEQEESSSLVEEIEKDLIFYIEETKKWFKRYLVELGIEEKATKIEIKSSFFKHPDSDSIIVGVLEALLQIHELDYDEFLLYKAAVLVQYYISKETSFAGLACAAFKRQVLYTKFDENIFEFFEENSLLASLEKDWEGLIIQILDLDLEFLVVDTNEDVDSYHLIERIMDNMVSLDFLDFLETNESLIKALLSNPKDVLDLVAGLDQNLRNLETSTKIVLFTEEIEWIRRIVSNYKGYLKFSGPGVGGLIICFFENKELLVQAKSELESRGFITITYQVKGVNDG